MGLIEFITSIDDLSKKDELDLGGSIISTEFNSSDVIYTMQFSNFDSQVKET